MFNKKQPSEDYVELSIGRVNFNVVTHGTISKITSRSTIAGSIINNGVFISLIEHAMTDLKKKEINNLSIEDGQKLRTKVREILTRYGILEKEIRKTGNSVKDFSPSDIEWFGKSKKSISNNYMKSQGGQTARS